MLKFHWGATIKDLKLFHGDATIKDLRLSNGDITIKDLRYLHIKCIYSVIRMCKVCIYCIILYRESI